RYGNVVAGKNNIIGGGNGNVQAKIITIIGERYISFCNGRMCQYHDKAE
ncbi:MAG: hypothetical protein ACI9RM_001427, partial [Ulvibacter sp.]